MTLPINDNSLPADEAARLIARLKAGAPNAGAPIATARLTRVQILQQAASAMLTQANGQPNAILALLR